MVSSKAQTVPEYLAELPAERRAVIAAVRKVVRKHLPKGYVEAMNWGMICYEIPLKRYPITYNKQPLSYAALAAQKNNYALYLMGNEETRKTLAAAFKAMGKKMDMGKVCLRFKKLEDLPLEAIGKVIASVSVDAYIASYEAARLKKK